MTNDMKLDGQNQQASSVLIIDSFALLFRGFYATASVGNYMKTSYGLYTNGVYQFTRYMLHAIDYFRPSHVVCAFDMGSKTFRNELYDAYKANRGEPPLELIPQFDKCWELVEAFNIPAVGVKGYEADDVIGTLSRKFSDEGQRVHILTGDGDTLQLINANTSVALMKKGFGNYELVDLHNLEALREITSPDHVIEMKAFMGDASDNIPGCPNVGPKTALKLIQQYETVDNVYAHIDEIKGKLKERLLEHKDQIYLSKQLATIATDLELDCSLDDCLYEVEKGKVMAKLEEFEFRSILRTFAS
ncbi:5'-3' exonuclease [Longirhabdus pacifica]|uniref:5'-3' exonuclease n=1 Tax=Longirhabdus pacifica TaxID=2305227 RepID=UPI0010092A0A|nr:5'-3' exonuclease H3TH domain-containing protein [Longirhabdus pacifica]